MKNALEVLNSMDYTMDLKKGFNLYKTQRLWKKKLYY